MSMKKVINWSYYSTWFPLGFRRMAPMLIANYISYGDKLQDSYFENGVGAQVEVVLAHNFVFDFDLTYLKKTTDFSEDSFALSFKGRF